MDVLGGIGSKDCRTIGIRRNGGYLGISTISFYISVSSVSAATADTTEETTAMTTAIIIINKPPPNTTNMPNLLSASESYLSSSITHFEEKFK